MVNQAKEDERMAYNTKYKEEKRNTQLHQAVGAFAKTLGVTPRNAIIEYFVEMPHLDHSLGDVAKEYELNRATTYNIARDLVVQKIIEPTRIVGKTQLYRLAENERTKRLKLMLDSITV